MDEFHGKASLQINAAPAAAFALITDIDRLPEWNAAIEAVVERPQQLEPGSEWTVKMHPPHMPSWGSISRLSVLDTDQLRFSYETRNADGNPSRVQWTWSITGTDARSDVTVSWDCYLKTLDRKFLAGPIRRRQLAREVPYSLQAIARALAADAS